MSLNTNSRIGKIIPEFFRKEDAPGIRFDSGPYIGVVKENRDPTRSGRLQVYIPDFGGDPDKPNNWRTVWYASPFLGSTVQESPDDKKSRGSKENKFSKVRHTYGMWYNVPDLENFVLCTFIAGDPERGYWFACIPNQLGHHMVPALGSSTDTDIEKLEDGSLKPVVKQGLPYPVVEYNEFNEDVRIDQFTKEKKPLHEPQVKILVEQGTDRQNLTKTRGIITSTSQRETPTGVFGISTPGRAKGKQPDPKAKTAERKVPTRLGGHSFVMDDGDQEGNNNLVRWRSAAGHQILMDDKEQILYIANDNGSVFMEFTHSGHLNVYCANSLNIRVAKDFNLHVEKDFNVQVEGDFRFKSKKSINFESDNFTARTEKDLTLYGGKSVKVGGGGSLDLQVSGSGSFTTDGVLMLTGKTITINSGRGPNVTKPKDLPLKSSADTKKDGNGQWQVEEDKIKSVSKIVPTHEPWPRKEGKSSSSSNAAQGSGSDNNDVTQGEPPSSEAGGGGSSGTSTPRNTRTTAGGQPVVSGTGGSVTDSSGNPILSGASDSANSPGIKDAVNNKLTKAAPESLLKRADAPNPSTGLGELSQQEYRGLLTQIAYQESGPKMDYGVTEQARGNYLGRYQMGAAALTDTGYIHKSALEQYGTKAVQYESSWTGKDGVRSKDDFLRSPGVQENAVQVYHSKLYSAMERNGAIKPSDDSATIGGMLQTAHMLGAKGAKDWRDSGVGADANKTSGSMTFNRGRYAVEYLGGKA